MNEIEFIRNKLTNLTSKYSGLMVYYEFKEESQTHFIKVLPEKVFQSREFKLWASEVISQYIDIFQSSISFIPENSLVRLDNPSVYYGLGKVSNDQMYPSNVTYKKNSRGLTTDIITSKKGLNENYDMAS